MVRIIGRFAACRQCILGLFSEKLEAVPDPAQLKDPKTRLQEYLQSQQKPLPEYTVIEVGGDAHAQSFRVQCRLTGIDMGPTEGHAGSRRAAEQEAAAKMLEELENG